MQEGTPAETDGDESPLDVIELQAAVLIRNAELLRQRTNTYTELDRAEYLLLRTLDATGPTSINTLAASLGLDASTAGRQVATMQKAGFVERSTDPADRRCSIITPTEQGIRLMRLVQQRRRDSAAELTADWTEQERQLLGRMFAKYNHAVAERYITPVAPEER